jgi:serine/threonine-protein kinase HipA
VLQARGDDQRREPGAVTFLPAGASPQAHRPAKPRRLCEEELDEALRTPPRRLFDPADPRRMRFALPGERHKLALVRDGEGWAWPAPGLPSTHIVKPEPADRPGLVANEHACSRAYGELGLPVAYTTIEEIAGHTCLVSKRFDRWGDGPGAERLHQESFAIDDAIGIATSQALGFHKESIHCGRREESSGVGWRLESSRGLSPLERHLAWATRLDELL